MAETKREETIEEAIVKALAELTNPEKSGEANAGQFTYKYPELPGILDQIRPVFAKHGLSLLQDVSSENGSIGVKTIILHKSGKRLESSVLYLPAGGTAQSAGSSITYARRYSIMPLLGLAGEGEDDDGIGVHEAHEPPRQTATASKTISANQAKLLHVVLGKANVDPETVKAFYKVEHLDELDKGQMDEVISDLERKGKVVKDGTGRYQTPEEAVTEDIDVPVTDDNVPW